MFMRGVPNWTVQNLHLDLFGIVHWILCHTSLDPLTAIREAMHQRELAVQLPVSGWMTPAEELRCHS